MRKRHHAFVAGLFVVVLAVTAGSALAAETARKPCLCQPMIRPMDGVTRTTFVASVRYRDPNGIAPGRIVVNISGNDYPLTLARGRAYDGIYRARLTLTEGEHAYYFYAENAEGHSERFPRYGAKPGPWVGGRARYNRQAILTRGGVHFEHGTDRKTYTFTVHYRDRDICKKPQRVTAVVDGIRHEMKLHSGTPNNGIYLYQAELPAGPHAYYFEAFDGDGECVTHPAHGFLRGPEVSEQPNVRPALSDNRIIPPTGSHRTKYAYTVHYKDADGDAPSIARLYVNDIAYDLKLASGKPHEGLYIHRMRHHVGWDHNYYFYFEDGRGGSARLPASGAFHGPIVTR
ncbi:MAG TPA: hypothetical protein ENN51_00040 [candidate division WOR-3 bacterium]|uniref:Uncharacterized protein n=1 Tax=candidate division WOR-3 bacterium TaxID=2052148 RepID=A0A7V0T4A3_UNCW3|nr:hypothetical protein [candidate division WOR-3 bacterium]